MTLKCTGYYTHRCTKDATMHRQTWHGDWRPVCKECAEANSRMGYKVKQINFRKVSTKEDNHGYLYTNSGQFSI